MAVSYEQFFPEVLPYLPDVAEPSAIIAIRNACIEFCSRTGLWQESFTFDTVKDVGEYTIPYTLDARQQRTMRLWRDQQVLRPLGKDTLTSYFGRDWNQLRGTPTTFTQDQASLIFVPVPDGVYTITYDVSFTPTRDSMECGWDPIYEEWLEVIAAGAIARLASMMGSPFYNLEQANRADAKFMKGISDAKIRTNTGDGRGTNQLRLRPFSRGSYPWR